MRYGSRFITLALVLAACVDAPETDPREPIAEATTVSASKLIQRDDGIANEYIVVLEGAALARIAPGARASARAAIEATIDRVAATRSVAIGRRYTAALRGFSARMTEADARMLAADPAVAFVEQNGLVHTSEIQSGATWGLDRIDQRDLPFDGLYNHTGDGLGATVHQGCLAPHRSAPPSGG